MTTTVLWLARGAVIIVGAGSAAICESSSRGWVQAAAIVLFAATIFTARAYNVIGPRGGKR